MNDGLLERAFRSPSRRWTIAYLGAYVGGYLLTTYAARIADKLAPEPPALDDKPFEAMMGVDLQPVADDPECLDIETPDAPRCLVFDWCVSRRCHSGFCVDEQGRNYAERERLDLGHDDDAG